MRNALTDYPYVQPENSLSMYSGYIPKSMSRPISTITGKPEPTEAERFQLYENSLLKKAVNYLMQNALYKGQRGPPPEWIDRSHPNFTPSIYGDRELTPAMMEIPADPPNALRKVAGMGLKKVSKLDNALDMTRNAGKADIPVSPKAEGGKYKNTLLEDYGTQDHINSIQNDSQWGTTYGYKELWVTHQGEGNWRDGHKEYDHIKNPIARIRVTLRNSHDSPDLFIEEIQGPDKLNQAAMPSSVRNGMYESAIKHIVSWASRNNVNSIVLPDAESIHVGLGWETGNLSHLYDKVLPSILKKELGEPEFANIGNWDVKYWEIMGDATSDPILPSPSSRAGEPGIKGEP